MIEATSMGFYVLAFFGSLIVLYGRDHQARRIALFFVNIVIIGLFFFYRRKHFVALLGFLLVIYLGLRVMLRNRQYANWVGAALGTLSLLFLAFFKYELVREPLLRIFPVLGPLLRPAVLLGVSFFVFRVLHIIVDVATEAIEELDLAATRMIHFSFFLSSRSSW